MTTWGIAVHALDRTGPPMLALALLRWLAAEHPDDRAHVTAVRGGPLLGDFIEFAEVDVILDPEEAWDPERPDTVRITELANRLQPRPPSAATLLVSTAAGAALPFLGSTAGPIVTWVVEEGAAMPPGLVDRTDRWLGGSNRVLAEIAARVGDDVTTQRANEFVSTRPTPTSTEVERMRRALGATQGDLLVVGAGIATVRKGPDLFLELALECRRHLGQCRFVWIGGERDELFHKVQHEASRLAPDFVRLVAAVTDIGPWLAAADVFAHTARLDAFPLVCIEAALAGTPVVAFDGVGGVPEMLGATFRGAPFPDLVALAREILQLADESLRRETGELQRQQVVESFTAHHAAPSVYEALRAAADSTESEPR